MNTLTKLFIGALCVSIFTGCGTTISVLPSISMQSGETELLKTQRKYVGEPIYTGYNYEESFKARISGEFNMLTSTCSIRNAEAIKAVVQGFPGASVERNVSCKAMMYPEMPMAGTTHLADTDGDGKLDKVYGQGFEGNVKVPMRVKWKSDRDNTYGYKKEVIYQGREGDTLRLNYREYVDDLARPAFSQTSEYNIQESPTLQFRGLTIDVEQADNETITYTIVAGTLMSDD